MGLIAKELGRAQVAGSNYATADPLVINPTQTDTIITKITLYNSHSAAVQITLCRVLNNAGSVGTATVADIFFNQSIAAYDTVILGHTDVSVPLVGTNDSLQAYADSASKINVFVDGFTLSDQS